MDALAARPRGSDRMGCANVAHAFAALPGADKLRVVAERRRTWHRHGLQRHAVGAPALRGLPGADPRRGAPPRRHRAGGRWRAGHVRRRHPGPAGHGAEPVLARHHRHGHGHRAEPRRVRRRAAAGRVRQDRARPADRRAALRPPALCVRARRPDGSGPVQQRQGQGARAAAQGLVGRDELLARPRARPTTAPAPAPSTAPPTATRCCWRPWACTCPARPSCTRTTACAKRSRARPCATALLRITRGGRASCPSAAWWTNACIVNAMVALLATGGSDQPPDPLGGGGARGRHPDRLDDFAELSAVVPLLARVYPNGRPT
jgi:phosphogluconate dehydratase